jgi:CelD/BcsL family acetyltransferase involved in cellulose biosynthesis
MAGSPLLRPGWVRAWWLAFGQGTPMVLAARRDGRLAGVLPLDHVGGSLWPMVNDHAVELPLVAEDEQAGLTLATGLVERIGGRIVLPLLEPARPGLSAMRDLAASGGCGVATRIIRTAPYVAVDGDFEDYEQRLRSRLRADLRRRLRRLEERGEVEIKVGAPDDGDDVPRLLEEGFSVEASGWKGEESTAISSSEDTHRFYREAAAWAVSRGLLHLAFLRLDGRLLAFEYSLRDESGHYRLKVGFEADHTKFAPGKLLLRAVLEDAFAHRVQRFEFLGGGDPYKLEWATGIRDLVTVDLFTPTARGRAALALRRLVPFARGARALLRRR